MSDCCCNTELSEIIKCLEQKKLLIITLLDVTKEIEVQSLQEEIDLARLFKKRQDLFERIEKCDKLVKKLLNDFPDEQALKIKKAIKGNSGISDYSKISKIAEEIKSYGAKIIDINNKADSILKSRQQEYKNDLAIARNHSAKNMGNMFK